MGYEVTIGIPVYNVEKYIKDSLCSALSQDFESIEFLVLDDCGEDHSLEIVRKIKKDHQRGEHIHIISQPYNMGIGAARNRLLDEARGNYLFFLDADDTIAPSTISLMVGKAKIFHADIVMASYQRVEMCNEKKIQTFFIYQNLEFTNDDEFANFYFGKYGSVQVTIWNILISRDLLVKNRLRFQETNYWEDLEFMYKFVTIVKTAILLPTITYTYFCRANSLSNFQVRDIISKDEILRNSITIESLKSYSLLLVGKAYFSNFLFCVLKTDFYIVCNVVKNRKKISPKIHNSELVNMLKPPLNFVQCLEYGDIRHVCFWLLGRLYSTLSLNIIRLIGIFKGLI